MKKRKTNSLLGKWLSLGFEFSHPSDFPESRCESYFLALIVPLVWWLKLIPTIIVKVNWPEKLAKRLGKDNHIGYANRFLFGASINLAAVLEISMYMTDMVSFRLLNTFIGIGLVIWLLVWTYNYASKRVSSKNSTLKSVSVAIKTFWKPLKQCKQKLCTNYEWVNQESNKK